MIKSYNVTPFQKQILFLSISSSIGALSGDVLQNPFTAFYSSVEATDWICWQQASQIATIIELIGSAAVISFEFS